MMLDAGRIADQVCKSMCADVRVHSRPDGRLLVETPFEFGDGDVYAIYLEALPSGGVRITDAGHTLMHLSYEHDVAKFREGTRGRLFERILRETGVAEEDGEFFIDSPLADIGANLFRFGQALTKLHDLTFLKRARVESTFYDDLGESLKRLVPADQIQENYIVPNVPDANLYPVDYRIEGKKDPLFVFGIPSRDKARMATIVLQHLLHAHVPFDSLLVFANEEEIPRSDLARLSNAGGEMVSSLGAQEDLERKVRKKAA